MLRLFAFLLILCVHLSSLQALFGKVHISCGACKYRNKARKWVFHYMFAFQLLWKIGRKNLLPCSMMDRDKTILRENKFLDPNIFTIYLMWVNQVKMRYVKYLSTPTGVVLMKAIECMYYCIINHFQDAIAFQVSGFCVACNCMWNKIFCHCHGYIWIFAPKQNKNE